MKDINNEGFVINIEPDNPEFTIKDTIENNLIKAKLIGHDFVRLEVIDLDGGRDNLYSELYYDQESLDDHKIDCHNYLKKSRLKIFCEHTIDEYNFMMHTDPDAYAI